jgi:CarD family transcriptional regulator
MSVKQFKIGMFVFCKNHGLGFIRNIMEIDVLGTSVRCFEVLFEKENVVINIPEQKMGSVGVRHLIPKKMVQDVLEVLKQQSKGIRTIWSKRSKEYEQKLQSGDIFLIAEIVRDLHKNTTNPNRSYTERVIYEKAFFRLASELSVVTSKQINETIEELSKILSSYQETFSNEDLIAA